MAFREKVRRAFHRSSPGSSPKNNGKIKIEYYRRNEVPRSKYRGPFDPEHQKKLRAWSFEGATVDRCRSLDLELSPCTSLGEGVGPADEETTETEPPDLNDEGVVVNLVDESITVSHHEIAPDRQADVGSQSSTAVDSDSYHSSTVTLQSSNQDPPTARRDSMARIKETIRYTSPMAQLRSPVGKHMPFSPDDLARALNAAQICV